MIRISFEPSTPLIVLDIRINHIYPLLCKMALDTGATYTIITPEIAEQLGFQLSLLKETSLFTATQQESAYELNLKSIALLAEEVHNIKALCMPLPKELKIDGLLGLNFLKHFNIDLNFEKGILTLLRFENYV